MRRRGVRKETEQKTCLLLINPIQSIFNVILTQDVSVSFTSLSPPRSPRLRVQYPFVIQVLYIDNMSSFHHLHIYTGLGELVMTNNKDCGRDLLSKNSASLEIPFAVPP